MLDLNMGYDTIQLNPSAQDYCTIVIPWGKYAYTRLPMGLSNAPDIFKEKMSSLFEELEHGAGVHNVDIEELLEALNKAIEE